MHKRHFYCLILGFLAKISDCAVFFFELGAAHVQLFITVFKAFNKHAVRNIFERQNPKTPVIKGIQLIKCVFALLIYGN